MVSAIFSKQELLQYINYLRKEMINTGLNHGLSNNFTIEASQELDYFIFQYQTFRKS